MKGRSLIGVLLLVGVFLLVWLIPDEGVGDDAPGSGSTRDSRPGAAGVPDGSPTSCLPCHSSVVEEWRASMHAMAFTDPQVRAPNQSDNFRKTECLPCHASGPVFEYGIEPGSRVLARVARRHDGIDCLSCHGLPDGGVAAARTGLDAACRPAYEPLLSKPALCAPCHNQHNTHDEWQASPAAARGDGCRDCHMPRVERAGAEAGAPRVGRSHRFLGGRDPEFALAGLSVDHDLDVAAGRLTVTLTNTFAGHNLPSDSRNRALDLVVTLFDARGAALPGDDAADRHPGGETGTARLRFRNPYRSSGNPSTQLPAGESRSIELDLPDDAQRARIDLVYKLEPWIPDSEAAWTESVEVDLTP